MALVSRLFATNEMIQAAREFRVNQQARHYIKPLNENEEDEDTMLEDYFLAGCIFWKHYIEELQNKKENENTNTTETC